MALFTRLNKRMLLTPAGERLLTSARTILAELERAEEDVKQTALQREGLLRLSTECYTCYHWLPAVLQLFQREYPRIEVQIIVEATSDPHQALLAGKIDLALVSSPVRNSKLVYKPLFQDELVVILSKEPPLSARPFIRAEDFRGQHLLIYGKPEENRAVQQVLTPAGVVPKRVSSVQLTEVIVEMVKAGLGLGILSRWSVAPQIEAGVIRALPLTKTGLYRRWAAATLKNKAMPTYLHAFIKLLADNSVLVMRKGGKAGRRGRGARLLNVVNCLEYDGIAHTA